MTQSKKYEGFWIEADLLNHRFGLREDVLATAVQSETVRTRIVRTRRTQGPTQPTAGCENPAHSADAQSSARSLDSRLPDPTSGAECVHQLLRILLSALENHGINCGSRPGEQYAYYGILRASQMPHGSCSG